MRHLLALLVCLTACHPRLSAGYDTTARTTGPLANLQTIPRLTAITNAPAPAPPEGRNYSAGLGFGDKLFTLGIGLHANNISKSTLAIDGAQYISAAGSLDFRFSWLTYKHFSSNMQLAPTRTLLVDSTAGSYTWGIGMRYGTGVAVSLSVVSIYADVYQERTFFFDGPADGVSTRTGMTVGIALQ